MNILEQGAARVLPEVEHNVAQKDDVECIAGAAEREAGAAEIGLAEVAKLAQLRFGGPLFTGVIEVTNEHARREAAIDLDAAIAAALCALDYLGGDVGALDLKMPADQHGKVLGEEHGERVGFLAGGAGCAPDAQAAGVAAGLD